MAAQKVRRSVRTKDFAKEPPTAQSWAPNSAHHSDSTQYTVQYAVTQQHSKLEDSHVYVYMYSHIPCWAQHWARCSAHCLAHWKATDLVQRSAPGSEHPKVRCWDCATEQPKEPETALCSVRWTAHPKGRPKGSGWESDSVPNSVRRSVRPKEPL